MIRVDVVQGTPEWELARIGMPTASNFAKILTPKKLQPSADAPKYRNQILAEWLLGYPIDWGNNAWMERGKNLEAEARAWYELQHDVDVELVGFIMRDDGKAGGSPDGFIGADGGADFKVPLIHTHVGYMLDPQSLADEYRSQAQGYLYLSGRDWWKLVSYNPILPAVEVTVERDPRYLAALEPVLNAFVEHLDECKEQLREHKQATVAEAMAGAV